MLIGEEIRKGGNSIDKDDFLQIYPFARNATFKASNIQNSFRGAGLVPLDANHVLEKLNTCVESVNSLSSDHPLRPTSSSSTSDLDTLWGLSKIQKTSSKIKKGLEPSSGPMTSPLERRNHRSHDSYSALSIVYKNHTLKYSIGYARTSPYCNDHVPTSRVERNYIYLQSVFPHLCCSNQIDYYNSSCSRSVCSKIHI